MLFCKTQPALVATFAAGITWYLNPAARRWSRLQLHARRGQPPPSRAAPVPVEKRARGPTLQHHPQYQLDVLPAAAVGPKRTRSVMSAALVSEPESPATCTLATKRISLSCLTTCSCSYSHRFPQPNGTLLEHLRPAASATAAAARHIGCANWACTVQEPPSIATCASKHLGSVLHGKGRHSWQGTRLSWRVLQGLREVRHRREAATVTAGHHGWRLPLAGSCTPVRHLSKLELDTMRVRFCVRAMSRRSEPYAAFLDFWIADLVLALSAPCLNVDAQVRRQQTLELGALLFRAAMDAWRWCPGQCSLLHVLMSCPGTPLDASWLASRVIPYLKDPVLDVCTEDLVHRRKVVTYRQRVVERLSQLKLPVLQDHPEITEWLQQNTDVKRPSLLQVHLSWVYAPARARRAARRYKPGGDDALDMHVRAGEILYLCLHPNTPALKL